MKTSDVLGWFTIFLFAVFALAWGLQKFGTESVAEVHMKCLVLENKDKQGLGLTFDEKNYKAQHCDLY